MSTSIQNLSTFTGLSEVELQRRAQEMVTTGKAKGLSTLDAALLASTTGPKQTTVEAFGAMAAATQQAHALEEPAQVLARAANDVGFAAAATTSTPSLASANSSAVLDKAATAGAMRVQGFVGENLDSFSPTDLGGVSNEVETNSRNLDFEQLKTQIQRMSQMQQLMSGVLSSTHETMKSTINNLKA